MGGFLVVMAALLLALLASILPLGGGEPLTSGGALNRPSVQVVAGNLVQYHAAAVDFVTANRNPASTTWTFTDSDQSTVRCASSYTGGTYAPCSTEFAPPGFLAPSVMGTSANVVDWTVYYKDSTEDIVVTYATSSSNVAGYAPAQIARALDDFSLGTAYSDWYWGVVAGGVLPNPSNLTMPTGYAGGNGVVAIATVLP